MVKKKQATLEEKIDKLAAATERGFKDSDKKIADLAAATERGFKEVDKRFDEFAIMVQRGFEETASKSELARVRSELIDRLDRIENIPLRDHNNRIERLEDKLLQVEVILGKKLLN